MLRLFIYVCLWGFLAFTVLVHAQSQSGFISIDCGIGENSSYTDTNTGLNYVSDSSFFDGTGLSYSISLKYATTGDLDQQFGKLRSFPEGDRNCYTLRPSDGKDTKYLIRARFMYGDYDGTDTVPAFDLYIGANKWGSVKLDDSSTEKTMEIIYIPRSEFLFVCVVNTGHGTPFVSALELRPLQNSTYAPTRASVLYRRIDVGSQNNKSIRYKDDVYDRLWEPFNFPKYNSLSTSLAIDSGVTFSYQPSPTVMSTAMSSSNGSSNTFAFHISPENPDALYYVYMYFAELEKLLENESRMFEIFENGEPFNGPTGLPISPDYLFSTSIYSINPVLGGERIDYKINKTADSTHPPILNAFEAYAVPKFSEIDTHEEDAETMMKIRAEWRVKNNWQGDPCAPITYIWDGLVCSSNGRDPQRIISLNLSSSGLTGEVSSHISDLTMIEHLDLSKNSLTGSVPGFLSKMQFLKVLDLSGNNLTGFVPTDLVKRYNDGSLKLSVSGNQFLCSLHCENTGSNNSKKKKNQYIMPVIASVAAVLLILSVLVTVWKVMKRRKTDRKEIHPGSALQPKSKEFSYSEISTMTNNFDRVIGRGGFGTVFLGKLNETEVAVKMLSSTSKQGPKEFQAEVKLLMRIHHRNLTSLIGYCKEYDHMGLIYEYMTNGNLETLLSDKKESPLSWEERLRIAVDAAQGLGYLHHGCRPPIIHRDIKTANILLNEKFQAKLADFGLSRDFSMETGSHVSTALAGTIGYLDPECFETSWLTEKSDVYSFGVVLLQIITNQPAIMKISGQDDFHVSRWVDKMMKNGEIEGIVDQRLVGNFEINSAWKALEIATACVKISHERPTMNEVVIGLKECLLFGTNSKSNKQGYRQTGDLSQSFVNIETSVSLGPSAR